MVKKERLQKVLSQAGLGSRRTMETHIIAGEVKVNGKTAQLGDSIGPEDAIFFQGKPLPNPLQDDDKIRILLYHKPIGEISSTSDPKHTRTVFDKLPSLSHGRWIQVGRLDINTSGLLLFTNQGELAHRLMHPRFGLEREYAVRVHGTVTQAALDALTKGVMLEDGLARFHKVEYRGGEGTNTWYHVVLTEGRTREVRRLWESQHLEVSRLIRVRYGKILMPPSLRRGEYYELTEEEVKRYIPAHDKRATPQSESGFNRSRGPNRAGTQTERRSTSSRNPNRDGIQTEPRSKPNRDPNRAGTQTERRSTSSRDPNRAETPRINRGAKERKINQRKS
jgi:23S rRNA pseudouridine2605 synthase